MHNKEGHSGYYSDLPCFGPIESIAFLESVGASHLHKLSERLMASSRSDAFFHIVESESASKTDVSMIPTLMTALSSRRDAGIQESCVITVEETVSRFDFGFPEDVQVAELNIEGINLLWNGLINFYSNFKHASRYVVPNVDIFLTSECHYGHFVFSIMMLGVASIVDFFERKNNKPSGQIDITLQVLNTTSGSCIGDSIQSYIEREFHFPVVRSAGKNQNRESIVDTIDRRTYDSNTSWLHGIKELAIEVHEDLCDMETTSDPGRLNSPVILLVIANIESLRSSLQKMLLDSYSSEPIRAVLENEWSLETFQESSPVIFMCSSQWLTEQIRGPVSHQIISKLNIKRVIHSSICEFGSSLQEELLHSITLLQNTCAMDSTVDVHVCETSLPTFHDGTEVNISDSEYENGGNLLLLVFRKFLMRYSSKTLQPHFCLPLRFFYSETAWKFYLSTLKKLSLAGAVILPSENDEDWPTVELSVLGRALTYRFRRKEGSCTKVSRFSFVDAKILFWSHLFRLSKETVNTLLSEKYIFTDWISAEVNEFSRQHNLDFGNEDQQHISLVRQLSRLGFWESEDSERTYKLLSTPSGRRVPIQQHAKNQSSSCRGWFYQAPLRVGMTLEKRHVNTYCLPPVSLYCDLEGDDGLHIQCPTEISYPLLAARAILHISLHNNCVFLEDSSSNHPIALSLGLLQSITLKRILDSSSQHGNVGTWLDGSLGDSSLAPTDSSMLSCLSHSGDQIISLCERSAFKRKRQRESDVSTSGTEPVFSGVKPRTAAESEIMEDFIEHLKTMGRKEGEQRFQGRKGFGFLEKHHDLHQYYLHLVDLHLPK